MTKVRRYWVDPFAHLYVKLLRGSVESYGDRQGGLAQYPIAESTDLQGKSRQHQHRRGTQPTT